MTAVDAFREAAAAHQRCFWLDGGGAREWSGDRSLIGILEPDDVSLTYSAARREVTRHVDGESEVVGSDVFAVLEEELAIGSHRDQWFGYFGYACRPDLPALVGTDGVPDAVWMRPSHVRLFQHAPGLPELTPGRNPREPGDLRQRASLVRRPLRPGPGAPARRQQLRGQPDLPAGRGERPRPGRGVPAAARAQPGAVRRLPAARRRRGAGVAAQLVAGAVRAGDPRRRGRPDHRDQADQGHHPARRDAGGGRRSCAGRWRPSRGSARRT